MAREIMVHSPRGAVQVVQYIDNVAGLLNGFTVQEWTDPRPEPYLAPEAVVKAITGWEAVERYHRKEFRTHGSRSKRKLNVGRA